MRLPLIVVAALFFTPSGFAADPEPPVTVMVPRLSMDMAMKLAKAGIDSCRKQGVNVAITVVDRSGHPQVVLRDTLAMDLSLPISRMKAYTAMTFNMPTSQMVNRFPGSYSVPKVDSILISPGGLPITGRGQILGGVGVSGAPSGTQDESCAKAGLDAVRFDLESN